MRNLLSFLLSSCLVTSAWASSTETYHIAAGDINNGYIVKKVWLKEYAVPRVQLINPAFKAVSTLPEHVTAQNPQDVKVVIGEVRKRYFAIVKIPAYSSENGTLRQLTDFTLVTDEQTSAAAPKALARTTGAVTNSPLASGNWYKISIPQRGIYKIDYDFIKNKLGVDPAGINTANIRLYGNGGTMLPENNAVPRNGDITENSIVVNDGGDGKFDNGDYVLFYATGPITWTKDSVNSRFTHSNNLYEDKSYYFLNFDLGAGKRIGGANNTTPANTQVTNFNDYQMHDQDLVNLGVVGKTWWGEEFSTLPGKSFAYDINFNLGQVTDPIFASINVGCVSSTSGNLFKVTMNGALYGQYSLSQIPLDISGSPVSAVVSKYDEYTIPATNAAGFHLTFTPSSTDGKGYLNYIELNYRRTLSFAGGQMNFRDWNSVGAGNVAGYSIQNANSGTQVWDVTDPLNPASIAGSLSGSTYSFAQDAARLHEFITFDGSQYYAPDFVGKIDNQNIHGQAAVDLIIVTYPDFLDAANQIADFHRQHENMRVLVATTGQIYNEFSSGSQDISAIRDAAKMFYDRAGTDSTQMPRYMLLFGDASYDYKNRIGANTNYVPTFESQESVSLGNGYATDDFFGFLGANEYIEDITIANSFDIGVGRIPVATVADANNVAAKLIHYKSPAALGPWRLTNTYVADNEDDAGAHLAQAEEMVAEVDSNTNIYNDVKVYLDNLPFVSTPGGTRCPDANKAINDQVYKGTFIINYNGHGSISTLAHERILTSDDFNQWKNLDKLPFMITATCDFARFDDPSYVSDGEKLMIKSDGGAIALLTTTQLTYAYANRILNLQFLDAQFKRGADGNWNRFGDAFREGKNLTYESNPLPDYSTLVNFRKFTLLGDPALEPNFPEYNVATDSIKTLDGNPTDTVSALGGYVITGKVKDNSGNLMSDFNGQVYVTIYDKARTVTLYTKVYNTKRTYFVQDNIIYKGKATVQNGRFSVKFVAPKDLNYDFGKGKISYYADNGIIDAAGVDTSMMVGGYSDNPVVDNTPPVVKPYMNDSFFVDGGITGTNTLLFVSLYDETGINISGNSVGHDLTAVLDGDVQNPYILNDYYENAPNDYQHGYVNFPITGLADGMHVLHVKAWDVNNNSGEGDVHFVVYNGEVMKIGNLMNYPNPFGNVSKETHFVFEHNHPEETLIAKLLIYNMGGQLVRSFQETYTPSGSRSHEITWDGTDQAGALLPDGVYVYKINLSTDKGIQATAYQKLVLIR